VSVESVEMTVKRNAGVRLPSLFCAFLNDEQKKIVTQICSTRLRCEVVTCSEIPLDEFTNGEAPFAVLLDVPKDCHVQKRSLEAIEALKKFGCAIVACGDDAEHWTVGIKSRVFLAGATMLVDSFATQFSERLNDVLQNALFKHQSQQTERTELMALAKKCGIIGESPALFDCFQSVVRMSKLSDLPALITGESGTGKELFASALHVLDPKRASGPFVAVNCAAVNVSLAESEFFGHVRGAFTGAYDSHEGYFGAANGGVLFLDEIGELTLDLQAKLLRVIQERSFSMVGSTREMPIDVRIISATHQDLRSMIHDKRFREDLFYRLNTLTIRIPPLRERKVDIALLFSHFALNELATPGLVLDDDFFAALSFLDFRGNVRELKNLVMSALVNRNDHQPLGLKDLPKGVWQELVGKDFSESILSSRSDVEINMISTDEQTRTKANTTFNLTERLAAAEREIISDALRFSAYNQSRAAQILGITPRCVYNKVKRYQIQMR
jgi:transcriptional regulator with GAF, ATPase, and Fis domain